MFAPVIDDNLGVLGRFDVGFLKRQAEGTENASDIGRGVVDPPFFANEIGDDPRGPTVGLITCGAGSLKDDGFEFLPLGVVEFFGTAWRMFSCEGLEAVGFGFLSPSSNGGERNVEEFDDFVVVESAQDQLPALESGGRLPG